MQEIDSHRGRDALERRELDVAIIRRTVTGRRLKSVPLRRDHFVVAMPEDHRLAGGEGPVSLAELRDESWVWLRRPVSPDYHDELVAACRQAGFSPEAQHYANSINSQLAMVKCGLGVTLAPESSVRQQPQDLVWRELRRRVDLVELSVVVRSGDHEPLVEHFIACSAPEGDRDGAETPIKKLVPPAFSKDGMRGCDPTKGTIGSRLRTLGTERHNDGPACRRSCLFQSRRSPLIRPVSVSSFPAAPVRADGLAVGDPAGRWQIQLEEAGRPGRAKSVWILRMIEATIPDVRSPGPSGPAEFPPSGGRRRSADRASALMCSSCQWTSSSIVWGRSGAASPAAFAAYAAAPKACAPMWATAAACAADRAAATAAGRLTSRAARPATNRRRISSAALSSPRAKARARAMASRGRSSAGASASNKATTRSAQSAAQAATIRRSASLSVCGEAIPVPYTRLTVRSAYGQRDARESRSRYLGMSGLSAGTLDMICVRRTLL